MGERWQGRVKVDNREIWRKGSMLKKNDDVDV